MFSASLPRCFDAIFRLMRRAYRHTARRAGDKRAKRDGIRDVMSVELRRYDAMMMTLVVDMLIRITGARYVALVAARLR